MSERFLTKAESVHVRLRDDILAGRFQSGERLRVQELARRFDVSDTPIREALRMLQTERLVDLPSHRGAIVAQVSWERVYETIMVRMHLETLAAAEAAPHHTPATLKAVTALFAKLEAARRSRDSERFSRLNREFHRALYEPAPWASLLEDIQSWWDITWQSRSSSLFHLHEERMDDAQVEHRALLDAMVAHSPKAAKRAAEKHASETLRVWSEIVEENPPAGITAAPRPVTRRLRRTQ